MSKIEKAGIYRDFDEHRYFADPCPTPSLTQSLAKIILAKSPLHAWYGHPRLNPDYQHDDDRKFDVGNIAHKLMIGRGKEITVLEFDDWRTKAAKEAREAAGYEGKLAVLAKHFAKADSMVKAAREQLELRGISHFFTHGHGEVVLAWQEGDLWLRQMIDWLSPAHNIFQDFKTTGESAAPHMMARKMVIDGWHIQAAMADRGLNVLDSASAGRRRYFFIVQEDEIPYALSVVEIGEAALTMGRKQLDMAVRIWRRAVETNLWPGYQLETVTPDYPGWSEKQWLDRELADEAAREDRPMLTNMAGG